MPANHRFWRYLANGTEKNVCSLNIFILITKQATGFQDKNGDVRNRVEAQYTVLQMGFGAVLDRHYCVDIQLIHVTELLLFIHRCHKLEWMWHCCSVTHCAVADHPSRKGCIHVLKGFSYSKMHESLTSIWYFELRATETPLPQAQNSEIGQEPKDI